MKKILILALFAFSLKAGMVYIPCEPSLALNTTLINSKFSAEYSNIQSKLRVLKQNYSKYNNIQKKISVEIVKNLELHKRKTKILLEMSKHVKSINNIIAHQ